MSIKRFFIIANRGKDQDQVFSGKIRDYLKNKGMTCHIVHLEEERIRLRKELNSTTDCLLVLGGDGTVLEAAHIGADTGTPILGINLGNLGYLAEIDSQNWEQALVRILNGDYEVESRMMLDGSVSNRNGRIYPGTCGHALNDIVVTRGTGLQILQRPVQQPTICPRAGLLWNPRPG